MSALDRFHCIKYITKEEVQIIMYLFSIFVSSYWKINVFKLKIYLYVYRYILKIRYQKSSKPAMGLKNHEKTTINEKMHGDSMPPTLTSPLNKNSDDSFWSTSEIYDRAWIWPVIWLCYVPRQGNNSSTLSSAN